MSPTLSVTDQLWKLLGDKHGLVLLGTTGLVLTLDPTAIQILKSTDEIAVVNGELRVGERAADLRELIRAMLSGETRPFVFTLKRPPRVKPLFLMGVAVTPGPSAAQEPAPAVALVISDPERLTGANTEVLRCLFALTRTEAEVASMLMNGMGPAEIAKQLNVSTHTTRGHVKSVMRKTGTKRQSDLVHLLFSCPAVSCHAPFLFFAQLATVSGQR
jgi:DNA-binding CsgD family transcriptional regulator